MTPTRWEINAFDPQPLLDMATGLRTMASNAEGLADRYVSAVSKVAGVSWTGVAAGAAQDRAATDKHTIVTMVQALEDAATAMETGYHAIEAPLTNVRNLITGAESEGFTVTNFLAVKKDGELSADEKKRRADWERDIGLKANEVTTADNNTQRTLASKYAAIRLQFDAIAASGGILGEHQFEKMTGRRPLSPVDFATAAALDPTSKDPKYKGTPANVQVIKIRPVPGQGVVRTAHFIRERDVFNPSSDGGFSRNLGDNRGPNSNFKPDDSRVTMYVDYENGIIVVRQNPSVVQNGDGSPGRVQTGTPKANVVQAGDGSVRIRYDAADPIGLGGGVDKVMPGFTTVNGDITITPTENGPRIDGERTDYPWFEAYRTAPDGSVSTIAVDPADAGHSYGPMLNLPFHHDIGTGTAGPQANNPGFYARDWDAVAEVVKLKPGVDIGSTDDPPDVSDKDDQWAPPRVEPGARGTF